MEGQRVLQPLDSHSNDIVKGSLLLSQQHPLHAIHKYMILGQIPILTLSFDFKKDSVHTELNITISV